MMELLQKLNIEGDIMVRAGQGILKILLVMLAVKLSIRILVALSDKFYQSRLKAVLYRMPGRS